MLSYRIHGNNLSVCYVLYNKQQNQHYKNHLYYNLLSDQPHDESSRQFHTLYNTIFGCFSTIVFDLKDDN